MNFASRLQDIQISMIRQIMSQAAGCINLGLGEPDFFAPQTVRAEAHRILDEEKISYSPNAGLPELQAAVKKYHGAIPRYEVCVCNGSQEALFDLIFALVDPGDEVLVPNPGFVAYPTVVRLAGGVPITYRLRADRGFCLDEDSLKSGLSERTKAVLLNTPSNPTGRVLSWEALEVVADIACRRGVWIISDEVYRETYYTERAPASLLDVTDRGVVISGASKMASMTGWRLGWAYGPVEVIAKTTVMHQYSSSCASTLSQKAALKLFTPEGRREVGQLRLRLRENRDSICSFVRNRLNRRFVEPEGAFYLMLDVSDRGDSLSVALELLKDRVATIPGIAFGTEGEGYLRVSFAQDPDTLAVGLERLARSRILAP